MKDACRCPLTAPRRGRHHRRRQAVAAGAARFYADQKQEPRARRLAFELIQKSNPKLADKLIPGLINDPSVELRREAVAHVLEAGTHKQSSKQTQAAVKDFARRSMPRVILIRFRPPPQPYANSIKVDLPRHFGLLALECYRAV